MADTATRVTSKFRRDVEKASKDKVGGYIVRHFRDVFAPEKVATVKSKGQPKVGFSVRSSVVRKSAAKKAKKK